MKYQKLRKSAKGRDCTLNIVGFCNYDATTTVLAHIDSEFKGMALKSPDWFACFSCSDCHIALDQHLIKPEEDREFYALRALGRTLKIWVEEGLIKI